MTAGEDRGILASIPGQYVSAATDQLPDPAGLPWKTALSTALEVPGVGRVGFTAECMVTKKGRSTFYYWNVTTAVLVTD